MAGALLVELTMRARAGATAPKIPAGASASSSITLPRPVTPLLDAARDVLRNRQRATPKNVLGPLAKAPRQNDRLVAVAAAGTSG